MRFERCRTAALAALAAAQVLIAQVSQAAAERAQADAVYRNGIVYTVDAHDSVQQALAVRAGRIVYVGSDAGLGAWVGPATRQVDLEGRMMMPGLVDGHMHPLMGGAALLKCSLDYVQLGVVEMQAKMQACLDATRVQEPDGWLEVVNWFQEGMVPARVTTTSATLDTLKTQRPLIVLSSFGHTALVNSRAIHLAGIGAATKDPLGGRIGRDAAGNPSGILEDSAQDLVTKMVPVATPSDDVKSARAALEAMRKQGITTFLDAMAEPRMLAAFASVERDGGLTARAHFAVLITPPEGPDPGKASAKVTALAHRYDQGPVQVSPKLTVRNVTFLAAAGARIAYGSDWPVDPLDEWFALKVGVTRTNAPGAAPKYTGRLSEDAGLSRAQVLRAITMNSSYELHQDELTGSLEPGKLADLIVLDRNVLTIPAEEIAQVKVLQTVVGGRVVYQAQGFAAR